MRRLSLSALVACCLCLITGCGQSFYAQGQKHLSRGEHRQAVSSLRQELDNKPANHDAWRELGIAHYGLGEFPQAEKALKGSLGIKASARAELYLGLTYEKQKRWSDAGKAYEQALSLDPPKFLRKRILTHQDRLTRRELIEEILANESNIRTDSIPTNSVAVYDFDGSRMPPELSPLALGLAEFTAISLAKIKSLEVIERMKLQLLLDEMELVKQGVVDPSTAPRIGRLLGSYRIVTGWLDNPQLQDLRFGSTIITTIDGSEATPEVEEGQLKKILELQVAFVYRILKEFGVEPSEAERLAIEELPTESYEAFLAYCRGLQQRRDGNYEQAEAEFEQALSLDAGFTEAGLQAEEVASTLTDLEFESIVAAETLPGPSGMESVLNNVVITSNVIENTETGTGGGSDPPVSPPVIARGSLTVQGRIND